MDREGKIRDLVALCGLSKKCFRSSTLLDSDEINGWLALLDYSEKVLIQTKKGKMLNSYQRKTIETELLRYWNDHLNIEVEDFWALVKKNELDFKRNPTYEKIVANKRFKNVEQAIDVYNDIYSHPLPDAKNEHLINKLDKLYEVVRLDRDKRIKQLNKWIRNERVSISDRMKFGENYAYLKRTGLYDEILGQKEKNILDKIAKQ